MANGAGGPTPGGGGSGESYLKSRAPSLGPEFSGVGGGAGVGGMASGELGVGNLGFPAELGGAMMGGEFGAFGEANGGFDSLMADDILSANGFWSSMLMVRHPLSLSLPVCSSTDSPLARARSPASAAPLSASPAVRAPSSATLTTPSPSRPSTRARRPLQAARARRRAAVEEEEEEGRTTFRSSRRRRLHRRRPRRPRRRLLRPCLPRRRRRLRPPRLRLREDRRTAARRTRARAPLRRRRTRLRRTGRARLRPSCRSLTAAVPRVRALARRSSSPRSRRAQRKRGVLEGACAD